ncbi:23S rRNA (uridine(2552)-2'-O)-methyltransferase RlmE [Blochmannia endosymbiont of Colobopsis nipponica]|uniref:23S rRNA (uridine(2552)-2'-O)-methyltransferase RlmE n=1 Tax=Blochmannia endosymbiont of Colobopsis nipponica TaxID=2681987 RepID=UPI00177AB7DF|nr:23S rRNA (uridine(2552)-2'-O)-methyltransferase RlmE [Blochmannia endosymbiont of Colobopsis nipponica]QOI10759.1 23S rRNA (uridine(2552)-2'-O)-methyltransferase RlmE [Blochmannia endosymbiont of Colobopsis nipponica]
MVTHRSAAKSIRWLHSHRADYYVKRAFKKHLRSRSWFKLANLQFTDSLFKPGISVVDLGSAPGGWSKYVVNKVGKNGFVIACDILPMKPIPRVYFLQGDLNDNKVIKILYNLLNNKKVQVILSDMSPNISGKSEIDIPRSIHLGELVIHICANILEVGGYLVLKIFQGEGFEKYLCCIRSLFTKVEIRKPDASRLSSREVYIVAKGYKI